MPHIPESHLDLLDSSVATFATVGPDDGPVLTEVWFLREGDSVALSLNAGRQKVKNLTAHPQCSLFILDLADPMRYLELRGEAEITPDDDFSLAQQVSDKYGTNVRGYDGPDDKRVAVRIKLSRVNAVNMNG
jgi:PPOX class probable F420-dependent enzyme